jgi:hypothetical protein
MASISFNASGPFKPGNWDPTLSAPAGAAVNALGETTIQGAPPVGSFIALSGIWMSDGIIAGRLVLALNGSGGAELARVRVGTDQFCPIVYTPPVCLNDNTALIIDLSVASLCHILWYPLIALSP